MPLAALDFHRLTYYGAELRVAKDISMPALTGEIVSEELPSVSARTNAVDILGIGAQKSATSWAAHVLNLHRNVWIPKSVAHSGKEVMFWDRHFKRGVDWYKKVMTPPTGGLKSMDVSPGYSRIGPAKVELCHQQSPDARIFLLLRNPIYRDWSSLLMEATLRHKFAVEGASFVDLMVFYDRTGVQQFSTYDHTFTLWHQKYGSQLLVGLYDEIVADQHAFYVKLCEHCGLEADAVPDWRAKVSKRIFKGPEIPLPPLMHEFLRKKYQPMIEKLQALLKLDLSDWMSDTPRVN